MDAYRRNELPETVKRYKTYTDSFQAWLLATATRRNIELATQISEQAKKKKVKKPSRISVGLQERLVNAIAESQQPLTDISGMRDLNDALRLRKEITSYYTVNQTGDAGHSWYNRALTAAKAKLTALITLTPIVLDGHDLEDEISNRFFIYFPQDESDTEGEEANLNSSQEPKDHGPREKTEKATHSSTENKSNETPLTMQEKHMKQELLVMCFLYQYNRIRGIVRDIWVLYSNDSVNMITAALVTDLAMDHIQQSVRGLVEELNDIDELSSTLADFIKHLYNTNSSGSKESPLSEQALRHLFCIEAIDHMDAYLAALRPQKGKSPKDANPDLPNLPFASFLGFYDNVRKTKIKLSMWDKFTEDMLLPSDVTDVGLPFSFQILIDVSEIVRDRYRKIYTDVTEHAMDCAQLMRTHMEYEDRMWAAGNIPEYMTKGDIKFSNVFLQPLQTLLEWVQELFKRENAREDTAAAFPTHVFVAIHCTLAGLIMSYYDNCYFSMAIGKTRWFMICLLHLYNAARQVGGLDLAWPDLDFIIEMHGAQRVFASEPPTKPSEFHNRFLLAIGVSARRMAPDYGVRGYSKSVSEILRKHGLQPRFPLEEKIRRFYGPDKKNERWLKRHAIFNHLHTIMETSGPPAEGPAGDEKLQQLRDTFSTLVDKVARPKSKATKKSPSRVPVPDISAMDDTYAPLLECMRSELQSHELHSKFDYLSLYRRTYALTLKIRGEVLFDENAQLVRYGKLDKGESPSNFSLIENLFISLKLGPKSQKGKETNDEVSTEVVPLDQLRRIAKIMREFIIDEGRVELNRAKLRLDGNWDALKSSYMNEKVRNDLRDLDIDPLHDDEIDDESDTMGIEDNANGSDDYGLPHDESQATEETSSDNDSQRAHRLLDDPAEVSPKDFDFMSKLGDSSSRGGVYDFHNLKLFDFSRRWTRKAEALPKKYQAYVTDEAEEESSMVDDLEDPQHSESGDELVADTKPRASQSRQDESNRADAPDVNLVPAKEAVTNSVPARIYKALKTTIVDPRAHMKRKADPFAFFYDLRGTGNAIYDPYISRLAKERQAKLARKPKYIFHRRTYTNSTTTPHKHSVLSSTRTTTARLRTCTRLPHRHARKHAVVMRCYALCTLARYILGRETQIQTRLRTARRILVAAKKDGKIKKKQGTPRDLHAAWVLAGACEQPCVRGRVEWEPEWESDEDLH